MIINQEGMRYTYNGMTYTVGAAVMATEASEYLRRTGMRHSAARQSTSLYRYLRSFSRAMCQSQQYDSSPCSAPGAWRQADSCLLHRVMI